MCNSFNELEVNIEVSVAVMLETLNRSITLLYEKPGITLDIIRDITQSTGYEFNYITDKTCNDLSMPPLVWTICLCAKKMI